MYTFLLFLIWCLTAAMTLRPPENFNLAVFNLIGDPASVKFAKFSRYTVELLLSAHACMPPQAIKSPRRHAYAINYERNFCCCKLRFSELGQLTIISHSPTVSLTNNNYECIWL